MNRLKAAVDVARMRGKTEVIVSAVELEALLVANKKLNKALSMLMLENPIQTQEQIMKYLYSE